MPDVYTKVHQSAKYTLASSVRCLFIFILSLSLSLSLSLPLSLSLSVCLSRALSSARALSHCIRYYLGVLESGTTHVAQELPPLRTLPLNTIAQQRLPRLFQSNRAAAHYVTT